VSFHYNYQQFLGELDRRGIEWELLAEPFYVAASYKGRTEYLMEMCNRLVPSHLHFMLNDKYVAKKLTQQKGYAVPEGKVFSMDQLDDALGFAHDCSFPVVIKASDLSKGVYVSPGIQGPDEFIDVWQRVMRSPFAYCPELPQSLLVEAHYDNWIDYRVMFVDGMDPVVLKRLPPYITGDGHHSILELVHQHNIELHRASRTCTGETYIFDEDGTRCLSHQGFDLHSILGSGERVKLRYNANETFGGTCEIVTDDVHPSYVDHARALYEEFPELSYLGIDLLVQDISVPCTPENYVVIEYATYPGYSLFSKPSTGEGIDIIPYIVDLLFPETKS